MATGTLYGVLKTQTNTGLDAELSTIFAAPINIISNQPVFKTETVNLRQIVSSFNVHRWELEANILPTNNSSNFLVHSVSKGYAQTIYLRMPQVYRNGLILSDVAAITVGTGGAVKGASTFLVQNNATKRIAEGEFINIGAATKVYLVISTTTDGSSITVYPALRAAINLNDNIAYGSKCSMAARYDTASQLGIKYKDGILSDPGSIRFVEVI